MRPPSHLSPAPAAAPTLPTAAVAAPDSPAAPSGGMRKNIPSQEAEIAYNLIRNQTNCTDYHLIVASLPSQWCQIS